ncbi:MAG: response regulator [Magnetococcales bacterium]|nr:response regulator [Magnetococcales bacterium]
MKKILIADDDGVFGSNLSEILRREGFLVQSVGSTMDAIHITTQESFDIILLDMLMPGAAREKTTTCLRRVNRAVKIISMTVCPASSYTYSTIKHQSDACITKPFGIHNLLGAIDDVGQQSENNMNRWPHDPSHKMIREMPTTVTAACS